MAGMNGMGGMGGGLGQFFSGLFGNSGAPFEDFMKEFQKYMNQSQQHQKPWEQAGLGALGDYQNNLNGMKDPQEYLKKIMSGYQESDAAKNMQRSSMNASNNAASSSGLLGSSALQQQAQQNAGAISSNDQQNYLNNITGIGNTYRGGLQNLMGGGQNASNMISQLLAQMGQGMGEGAAGMRAGRNQDNGNMLGGLFSMLMSMGMG